MNKKNNHNHHICAVKPGSIADQLGVQPGDFLISINDEVVEDIFDYRFLTQDEYLTLLIRRKTDDAPEEQGETETNQSYDHSDPEGLTASYGNGETDDDDTSEDISGFEEWEFEIEKDPEEDLGIVFDSGLMDEYRSCRNNCIFCFVNQMPEGMRESLYFHDDDARLSFLQGNYITLTNMSDHDIDRIIRYHLEPINISIHTMNPELRCRMLHNRFAGEAFEKIKRLKDAGIEMNGQIVLCRGINDKEELEFTLGALEAYLPELKSVSVVPVGLTKFRDKLPKLELFDKESAAEVIDQVEKWQRYYIGRYATHLVHASDEWYILAGRDLPGEDTYDAYPQLENGVGMIRLLTEEVKEALKHEKGDLRERSVTIACGTLVAEHLRKLTSLICEKFPNIHVRVVPIVNHFFGESITVSGLITGQDLIQQLKEKQQNKASGHSSALGDALLLPCSMLRSGEKTLLDDITVDEAADSLQIKVVIVESDGQSFLDAIIGEVSS